MTGVAEHQNWSKLPFHKPNENIARYGSGFSKILQQMRPVEQEGYMIASLPTDAEAHLHKNDSIRNFEQSRTVDQSQSNLDTQQFATPNKPHKVKRRAGSV